MSVRLALITAGLLLAAPQAWAQAFPTFSTEPGFDRPGGDFNTWVVDGNHKEAWRCQDSCFANPRCKAYTFVVPTTPEGNGLCRLKETVPAPVASNCCVSGVKGQRGAGAATKPPPPPETSFTAIWRALCQSTSPQAFEAMNLSGSMRIELASDGTLSGHIDGVTKLVLTGKRNADGTAAGHVITPDGARVPWKGEIKRASSGALSGNGSFELGGDGQVHRALFGQNCFSAQWGSR